jgi:lysophospholipase L1-like esterase
LLKKRALRWLPAGLLVMTTLAAAPSRGAALAGPGNSEPGTAGRAGAGIYLALGDSIAFGYDPSAPHTNPDDAVGYPTEVAAALSRTAVNASCPGETSGSFLSATGPDQGCRSFRAHFPLHVSYPGTQQDFATNYLRSHPDTGLVSLAIGINDLYHCSRISTDHCAAELTQTLASYRSNLDTILRSLRAVYDGPLVLVDYYSADYQDSRMTDAASRLNAIMAEAARTYQAGVADAFAVFAGPGVRARDICAAGLLIKLPHRCDIHPSANGRDLLAAAVSRAAESTGPARPSIESAQRW